MMFLALLLSLLVALIAIQVQFVRKRRSLARRTWESILAAIEPVDVAGLREIAECYLQPAKDQLRVEPNEMWHRVGGLAGLSQLRENADVMLQLAAYAELWNDANGRVISEMMRRDAVRLKNSLLRVQCSCLFSVGLLRAPLHLQEAISSYWLMRSRLLGMYSEVHVGRLPVLEAAL